MKPAPFGYRRPGSLPEALETLAGDPDAKVLAGGQSLVPLLNFRLARPAHLVDINGIAGLDTLERAMLIINDTPGSQVVRADVMPGTAVGTSDFAVGTAADPEHEGFVLLDNHGTKATGKKAGK